MTCTIEGCGGRFYARGWCHKHYERWRRNGTTDATRLLPEARFWAKVERTGNCWLWMGCLKTNGYGAISVNGKMLYAHRYSLQLDQGAQIPHGMEVDHLCHTLACVRPSHLRVVTSGQNGQNLKGAQRNSATGIRGVCPWRGKYRAQVQVDGKPIHVGTYTTIAEAEAAVIEARRVYMTHSEMDRVG